MNMKQDEIVNEIRRICGNVLPMSSLGWHFKYNDQVYFYVVGKDESMIRFCVPFVAGLPSQDKELLKKAVNDTNRNVKYIKALLAEKKRRKCTWTMTTRLQTKNQPRRSCHISSRHWTLRWSSWGRE